MLIILSSTLFPNFRNLHGLFAFLTHSVAVVPLSGISHVACRVACEQQMYFWSWLHSLPLKNNVCEPERQNDFHDTESFALMLASQNKGWNTARVTPHNLRRLHVLDFGNSYQLRLGP